MDEPVRLFSYGTLQQKEVQLASYGRELEGKEDRLSGYRLEPVAISRSDVVELSGKAIHTIACQTGEQADAISGMLYELTPAELKAADAYEDPAYERVEVRLDSGAAAWVYVKRSC